MWINVEMMRACVCLDHDWSTVTAVVVTLLIFLALITFIILVVILTRRHSRSRRHRRNVELQIRNDLINEPSDSHGGGAVHRQISIAPNHHHHRHHHHHRKGHHRSSGAGQRDPVDQGSTNRT